MNEERLTRGSIITIVVAGLITGAIALAATMFVVGNAKPSYTATTLVAIRPGSQLAPGDVLSYWEALNGGQAGRVAAEVFQQRRWVDPAAQAIGVAPADVIVTANVPPEASNLVSVSVETSSPEGAEQAATAIVKAATPVVQQVSGPFEVTEVQSAVGSAKSSSVPAGQLLIVAFVGGLLVGSGAALIIARARSRSDDEPEYQDSGEFRAVQGGYGRPAGPPPPGRPMPGPASNGNAGINGGQYGPPRRPVGDPRAQQQPPR